MLRNYVVITLITVQLLIVAACPRQQEQPETPSTTPETPSAATQAPTPAPTPAPPAAERAPDFSFTTFEGKTGKLSDYVGQPVVVNFWSATCGPCLREMPEFQEVYDTHTGEFVMLGIAVEEHPMTQTIVSENGFSWTFAYDVDGARKYGLSFIPRTLFVDREGNLVKDLTGATTRAKFEEALALIL